MRDKCTIEGIRVLIGSDSDGAGALYSGALIDVVVLRRDPCAGRDPVDHSTAVHRLLALFGESPMNGWSIPFINSI